MEIARLDLGSGIGRVVWFRIDSSQQEHTYLPTYLPTSLAHHGMLKNRKPMRDGLFRDNKRYREPNKKHGKGYNSDVI